MLDMLLLDLLAPKSLTAPPSAPSLSSNGGGSSSSLLLSEVRYVRNMTCGSASRADPPSGTATNAAEACRGAGSAAAGAGRL
jgi:hypothetical protein